MRAICVAAFLFVTSAAVGRAATPERVHVDAAGVLRWNANDREVALFGANYCLPSSSDYRAAGYVHADRKRAIEHDMAHFARMGWDGLRLALWGDWENCDQDGNLIINDHLDLLDYLIFQAKQRGISMLFTPIHRHSALWPDGRDSDAIQGFSKYYPAIELGRNPAAIAAQQNYLRQMLAHVNPYTGVALKDEPAILFLELINEPEHHPDDFAGSVAYINALVDAVRSTGCAKLLFFNLSQDFRMAPAIAAARVQGFSFGWYPTGLVAGHTRTENYLRWVDGYDPLLGAGVPALPRIVYEFDSADMVSGYMYPAMVRAFREAGAQFAAMFAYDMLPTAPYNLGWQTHYLSLIHSPRKAVSAVIAAEAMRTLPRGRRYGPYPSNRSFGAFRVSYEDDSSEMVTDEQFLYANDTDTSPPRPESLRRIVGCGRSLLVQYEGTGSYFLDRLAPGVWRLELYPDAVLVQDPFAQRLNHQTVSSRLVWRSWPMTLALPDLGPSFTISGLNAGNHLAATAKQGRFPAAPGVYVLSRDGPIERTRWPSRIGAIGLDEFVCPSAPDLPTQVLPDASATAPAGEPLPLLVQIIQSTTPEAPMLRVRPDGGAGRSFPLEHVHGYEYRAVVPAGFALAGRLGYRVTLATTNGEIVFPSADAPPWSVQLVPASQPLALFDSATDGARLITQRTNDWRNAATIEPKPAAGDEPSRLQVRIVDFAAAPPCAFALPVKQRVRERGAALTSARALVARVRGAGARLHISVVEQDGSTWGRTIALPAEWTNVTIPLAQLQLESGLKLPLGYPGDWNLDLPPPADRTAGPSQPNVAQIEHVQFRMLPASDAPPPRRGELDLASVHLVFP